MKFTIEQVALAPAQEDLARELLSDMGLTDWIHDEVVAEGEVRGQSARNEASLAFNYQAFTHERVPNTGATELELLKYRRGENWLRGGARTSSASTASHIGMHVTAAELLEWKAFFAERKIPVVQEVRTQSHSNEFLVERGRKYHYCIFGTRLILGVDVKFIVRIEPVVE